MAEDSDKDKTEDATSHKLKQARERGQVPKGMDIGFLAALTGLVGYGWARGEAMIARLASTTTDALIIAPQLPQTNDALGRIISGLALDMAEPVAVLAGTVWLAVLVLEIVQTGPVFAPDRLKPDFTRLNPAAGLKRLFTVRTLIEAGKSIAKLAVYIVIGWLVIKSMLASRLAAMTDARHVSDVLSATTMRLLLGCLLAALLFALVDQLLSRRQFAALMRMSRREVRRELRDREGDPRIKQRRKQIHREFVQMAKSLNQIRSADVVIVNPVHFAVALRYVPAKMAAPRVVSRGKGGFAVILKTIAFRAQIPVVHDPLLARSLFSSVPLDAEVDEKFYVPISDIYRKPALVARRV